MNNINSVKASINQDRISSSKVALMALGGIVAIPVAVAIGLGMSILLQLIAILAIFSSASLLSVILFSLAASLVITAVHSLVSLGITFLFKKLEGVFDNWLDNITEKPFSLYALGSYALIGLGLLAVTATAGVCAFYAAGWLGAIAPAGLSALGAIKATAIGLAAYAIVVKTVTTAVGAIGGGIYLIVNKIKDYFTEPKKEEAPDQEKISTSHGAMYSEHPEMGPSASSMTTNASVTSEQLYREKSKPRVIEAVSADSLSPVC